MTITEARRGKLLTAAVTAVRAWLNQDPGADPLTYRRLTDDASRAVTAAVVDGKHIHTLIAVQLTRRDTGLAIAQLIDDPDARARALVVERHAAERYAAQVRHAIRTAAVGRAMSGDRGVKAETAELFKISRVTLDKWIGEEEAGTAPGTPWEEE